MAAETDCRNLWLSSTEHKALVQYLGGIEMGLFQLRQGRLPVASSERQALQYIEQGCIGIRQILDVLRMLGADETAALTLQALVEAPNEAAG